MLSSQEPWPAEHHRIAVASQSHIAVTHPWKQTRFQAAKRGPAPIIIQNNTIEGSHSNCYARDCYQPVFVVSHLSSCSSSTKCLMWWLSHFVTICAKSPAGCPPRSIRGRAHQSKPNVASPKKSSSVASPTCLSFECGAPSLLEACFGRGCFL